MFRKLNCLYDTAKEIEFDNSSKLVFISDVHRGDCTYYDAQLPNKNLYKAALYHYYKKGFTYVEVGDGEELWKNKNCNDISYCYEDIFKILNKFKENNRIFMIYGNHDIIKKRGNFYAKQYKALKKVGADYGKEFLIFIKELKFYEALNFKYMPINEKFLVTHGHQVDFINSSLWMLSRFLVRYVWKFLNGLAGFKDPTSPAKSNTKGNKVDRKLERWAKENGKMILCGHTHNSRLPGKYEPPYLNDGCCVLPYAMTSIEIENGKVSLIKWGVEVQEEGNLCVKRRVIYGPLNVEEYLLWARKERDRMLREAESEKNKKRK
ncbi:metallophosphoesterase [Clostridium chauvoei]|uniref:Metallophosphoesterase n=2 Tax=Clostridium chauvoei TaxID=46867 RepID=A0ABD4RHJ3_9CLOT|nr:metallophosphoesterase [Clostridium chauvoei]ATD55316.1 serine/threonine protein phosphatase [Clostridium chauvoei]ATD57009.1 serine/threonine protein phosphatase [Clostridium chauvoei]MBX7280828.1 metallophosphoesterase [Clostridium chauvoei]MBX7283311.1 metallophosphoesterase [Clostridium chauvoei]MBX7285785.1 metallophosphoesterase [Clostridium chauvoei]